jgi:hypothetical protein
MRLASLLFAAALTAPIAAQTSYYADLDGTKETPPNGSTAGGWARVTLNPGNTVTYDVRVWGVTATAAHIHDGPSGVAGGIVVGLIGGPTSWTGTSPALTAAQVTKLQTQNLYVNVHSAAFPNGEIRGQLEGRPRRFAAFLNAAQETPASTSTAKGTGTFDVDLASTDVTYSVTWNGTGGTAAHLHLGAPGVAGGIEFPLFGGPLTWAGTLSGVGTASFTDLQTSALYTNIHSATKPLGEIRGQTIPSGIKYGDTALMPMDFEITGAPASGSSINLAVTGGNPFGLGLIMVSLGPGASILKGVPFMLDPGGLIITSVFVPLDGAGAISFPAALPDLGATFDVYMQSFSTSGGPVKSSNGVRLPLVDLLF